MTIDLIGIDTLPNTYIEKIRIYENTLKTTIVCDIVMFDYKSKTASVWAQHDILKKYLNINMCLVNEDISIDNENSIIKRVNDGNLILPNKILKKTKNTINAATLPFINNQKRVDSHYSITDYYDNEKQQYRYSIMIQTGEKLKNNSAIYTYLSVDVESLQDKFNISLKMGGDDGVNGPVACELIKSNGNITNESTVYLIQNTEQIWTGPIHKHEGPDGNMVFMAGEFHTTEPHPLLTPVTVENSKILYYKNLELKEFRDSLFNTKVSNYRLRNKLRFMNKKYFFPYCYEMESSLDEGGDIHKIFILDLCNMILRRSYCAKIIFDANIDLFMEIGRTLSLDNLFITRRKVGSKRVKNLVRLTNTGDVIPETNFYDDKRKRLTTDDNNGTNKEVSFIKQMQAGLPDQLMALYLTDHQSSHLRSGKYQYRLQMTIKDKFYDYVEQIIKDLHGTSSHISSMLEKFTKSKHFDPKSNSATKGFLKSFFANYNIKIDDVHGNIIEDANTPARLSNTFFVQAIDHIEEAFELVNHEADLQGFINKINPITATPESLQMALRDIRLIIRLLERRFIIRPRRIKSSTSTSIGSRRPMQRNILRFTRRLSPETISRPVHVGYKFIKFKPKQKMFKINKRNFVARSDFEVNKYFSATPNNAASLLSGVDTGVAGAMSNIYKDKFLHFTPQSVKFGNSEIDIVNGNNNSHYKALMVAREVKNIKSNPQIALNLNLMNEDLDSEDTLNAIDLLGADSPFVKHTIRLFKNRPLALLEDDKQLDDLSANIFSSIRTLRKRKKPSIRKFDPTSDKCDIIRKLRKGTLKPKRIPVQLKSLLLSRSSTARNQYLKNDKDIFDTHETNEAANQKFMNIQKLNYLEGFPRMRNGLFNLAKPIFRDMDGDNYNSIAGMTKICKMIPLADSDLELAPEDDDFNTFGSVFVLEDTGYKEPKAFTMRRKNNKSATSKKIINSSRNSQKLFSSTVKVKQTKKSMGMFAALSKPRKRKVVGIDFPDSGIGEALQAEMSDSFDTKDTVKNIKIDGLFPVGAEDDNGSENIKTKGTSKMKEEAKEKSKAQMKKEKDKKEKASRIKKSSKNLRKLSGGRRNRSTGGASGTNTGMGSMTPTTRTSGGGSGGSSGGSGGSSGGSGGSSGGSYGY